MLKILVVDDNTHNINLACMILENLGHLAQSAGNGLQTLEILLASEIDVLLLDLEMPVMDGLTALKYIRMCEQESPSWQDSNYSDIFDRLHVKLGGSHLPVIVLTAHDTDKKRRRCRELGADGFLTKPFDVDKIIEQLRNVQKEKLI